jgi:hypothetical protein
MVAAGKSQHSGYNAMVGFFRYLDWSRILIDFATNKFNLFNHILKQTFYLLKNEGMGMDE